jgi:hypothetical protein
MEGQENRESIGPIIETFTDGRFRVKLDPRFLDEPSPIAVGTTLVLTTSDGAVLHVRVSECAGVDDVFTVTVDPPQFRGSVWRVVNPAVSHV